MGGESEGKRGWSGHRGRKPSSSEVGEGFQGARRDSAPDRKLQGNAN
jgi:hypothetical protein